MLRRQASNNSTIALLDQGPVFMLAWLYRLGLENLKGQSTRKWWNSAYKRWADTLDMVIWLDASDVTLVERVRARERSHGIKEKSDPEAFEFLARWRAAYEQVLAALTVDDRGPKVFHIDTAQHSLDEVVNKAVVLFGFTD